jgi:hypothetical protein
MLERDTTASISISGNTPRTDCSNDADPVRPVRDNESDLPRVESFEGSSLLFIVRSFPTSLECDDRYYDLG